MPRRSFPILGFCLLLTSVSAHAETPPALADVKTIVRTYCLDCHSAEEQKGDLDLETSDIHQDPKVWEQVLDQIELGEMPPKKSKQMSAEETTALTGWIQSTLDDIALGNAGDPGPVVLRRLSNMEYTYTLRDLTGVETLDPAREFPIDGAAGEGFTNAGAALVMSPGLLTKYLDAAKEVAGHAVFTGRGFHWSAGTSPQDWTDEALAAIRRLYARYTTSAAGTRTVQQGIDLDTGTGEGRIPLTDYLEALQGRRSLDGLSPKYLGTLRAAMEGTAPSVVLDGLRARFREGRLTAADIEPWQRTLWKFGSVGFIGSEGKPRTWQEAITPLVASQELRVKLEGGGDRTLYLVSHAAGEGSETSEVLWENARLTRPGRPDLPIGNLKELTTHLEKERTRIIDGAEASLNALVGQGPVADAELVGIWKDFLGFNPARLEPLLATRLERVGDRDFIQGWTAGNDLSVIANSSGEQVRIPGLMLPHSVSTHPAPDRSSVIAWQSPVSGRIKIAGNVVRGHPECGYGVTWALEVRRGQSAERLAAGVAQDGGLKEFGPFENVQVEAGQVVTLVIGPHNGSHACGLTTVNLTIGDGTKSWDLAGDVSPDILAGNPQGPWHFLGEPAAAEPPSDLPAPIVAWRRAPTPELATKVREHLEREFPLSHPLLSRAIRDFKPATAAPPLSSRAPSVLELVLPAALAEGAEFVTTVRMASASSSGVQAQVLTERPGAASGRLLPGLPVIAAEGSDARSRLESGFEDFRALFPAALCYTRIVPVDEVVTLTLFHREDDHLRRLMLGDSEADELDRLWEELFFVSEAPLKLVDAYEQIVQYATQDRPDLVEQFAGLREPILRDAEAFKRHRESAVAAQKQAVIDFAARAWRRPLRDEEIDELRAFDPPLMLVRVLASPSFLYKAEDIKEETAPVNDWELATRLSYFLWSSAPDDELRAAAAAGRLRDPDVLAAQARRMLKSPKITRLATEFGCQYLHVRDVATLDEKSERHFPTFPEVRGAMQEEVARFITDLFQENRPVLSLVDADHTFVNAPLAAHYGLPVEGDGWRRVEGVRDQGRGGLLGFAATLAKHAGASRTSAILRGTWISEVVLGDKLPPPPKGVPVLPDEAPTGLTERQLIERHSSDPNCAACHKRIDPYGFALEGFDAIGRLREADTATELHDGVEIEGLEGLRDYLLGPRRQDFLEQFSRKLVGYALGRGIQLSDRPLVEAMVGSDLHAATLVEHIVRSRQFREVRGKSEDVANH
jgi:hypothetical protein